MSDPTRHNRPTAPNGDRFACAAARLLADGNCHDVIVLNLRGLSPVTDFFVLATGTSDRQIASLARDLRHLARHEDQAVGGVHGGDGGSWVIGDFYDVVVHLFAAETRAYYDLESLWGDAERIDWQAVTRPGEFAHLLARSTTTIDA